MRRQTLIPGIILVFFGLLIALTGCEPDLVPANPNNKAAFCDGPEDDGSILWVHVKNQGNDYAPSSHTKVEFYCREGVETVVKETGGLGKDGVIRLDFPIPSCCWHPDCGFKITVDCNEEVDESDEGEGNNSVEGNCVG